MISDIQKKENYCILLEIISSFNETNAISKGAAQKANISSTPMLPAAWVAQEYPNAFLRWSALKTTKADMPLVDKPIIAT